ncbi:hypothetical protein Tco_1355201 [Tanacetum coccineum]
MKAEALKEQTTASRPTKALTVYPPNTPATLVPRVLPTKSQVKINIFALIQLFSDFEKTCNKRITPTGLTEGERGFEQTKACYLTEVIPFFKTLKEHFEGIQKALTKEVKEMKEIFEELEAEVDQHVLNVSSFTEMHDAHTRLKARCLELKIKLPDLRDKIQKYNHDELIKRFSNLEVNHLNLQLKYQNIKESFGNNTSPPNRDVLDFDSVFVIKKMKASIQGKDNAIKKLRMQISRLNETRSEADHTLDFRTLDFQIAQLTEIVNALQEQNKLFRVENRKIKQHYKELYDSIKITRAKHLEQTTALLTENESLKVQIRNRMSCVTKDHVKPKVLAPGKYVIDVAPIPLCNRNNREVHLEYLKHLKESVETLRKIVEEAKVERPLDRSLSYACLYTKHSQELLEYVIGTCLKDFNKQDKKHAFTPLTRKSKLLLRTNVNRVNNCTDASGSQPRSNTKKNRILSAKNVNKKKVEEHPRTNKSSLKTTNRVDSSISSKLNYLHSVNASPSVKNVMCKVKKVWKPKQVKQVWKATGKVLTTVGYQWRPTGRIFTLGEQCPLTRLTKPKVVPAKQTENVIQIVLWYLDSGCSKHMTGDRSRLRNFIKKFIGTVRLNNDHFGAIMGYGDYVIGDSVISRVYYVEGLGHNLFSVRQFCDSNLEVAFRKHSCYV